MPLRRKRLAASAAGGATAFAQPKPVGAQYRTHSLRRRLRQAGQQPGIRTSEMKRRQPAVVLRRDSRSGRESPRLLSFRARFSFMRWPDRDGGLAALAPLRGAKTSAAAAPARPGGQWRPGFGRESSGRPGRHPPLDALRFAELPSALPGGERRLGAVHETSGGPSRSPPPLPFASEGARGPPRSIFGHFLLIKKVATPASDVCLTNSQTTNTSHGTR